MTGWGDARMELVLEALEGRILLSAVAAGPSGSIAVPGLYGRSAVRVDRPAVADVSSAAGVSESGRPLASLAAESSSKPGRMEVAGVGGGGGMYQLCISPYDSDFMLLACDMSGQYRSLDGGQSWELIHMRELNSNVSVRPAFTADWVYAMDGARRRLRGSDDEGVTWQDLVAGGEPWSGTVTCLGAIAGEPDHVFVGTDTGLWRSLDGGASWALIATCSCRAVATVGSRAYVAADYGLVASLDGGTSWSIIPVPPAASHNVLDVAAAQVGAAEPHLYVIAEDVGVLRSTDGGASWGLVQAWDSQSILAMSHGQTQHVYACQQDIVSGLVWASHDGGDTWTSTFRMRGVGSNVNLSWIQTQLLWGYKIMDGGLAVDPDNPDVLFVSTQGELYRSADGGASWDPAMSVELPDQTHVSIGLEVTRCDDYQWDPNNPTRQYICYADIGFARSSNDGASYAWCDYGNPWQNTTYRIAFDPYTPGRIYAASSTRHGIPNWIHVTRDPSYGGGVAVSDNGGFTWSPLGSGLPDDPCTDILVDPASLPGALVLYAASFGNGVFKSTDGGQTWVDKSVGLGNGNNHHALRLAMDEAGNLYCLVTALREDFTFPDDGGVWHSSDGGETWTDITAGVGFGWPTGLAVVDPQTIYVSACSCQGHSGEGGVWKTTDGGATWTHVLTQAPLAEWHPPSYAHAMCVVVHPDDANIIYCGTAAQGMWISLDAGGTWVPFGDLPFGGALNVSFDPRDTTQMVVTTYGGGVWKGHCLPSWPTNLRDPIPGDANGDGMVDGADYTAWADHYKQPGGWGDGDFTGNGFVDGADYTVWADHYGQSVGGASTAVGERSATPAAAEPPSRSTGANAYGPAAPLVFRPEVMPTLRPVEKAEALELGREPVSLTAPAADLLSMAPLGGEGLLNAGVVGRRPPMRRRISAADALLALDVLDLLEDPDLSVLEPVL